MRRYYVRNEKRKLLEAVDALLDKPAAPGLPGPTNRAPSPFRQLKASRGGSAKLSGKRWTIPAARHRVGPELKSISAAAKEMAIELFRPFGQ
jgi:DNA-directed RNA polymerase beta' subunit